MIIVKKGKGKRRKPSNSTLHIEIVCPGYKNALSWKKNLRKKK